MPQVRELLIRLQAHDSGEHFSLYIDGTQHLLPGDMVHTRIMNLVDNALRPLSNDLQLTLKNLRKERNK